MKGTGLSTVQVILQRIHSAVQQTASAFEVDLLLLEIVAMQAPQKEIYEICKPLLVTRSLSDVEKIVDRVFTDDAVFTHPLIISKGKEAIIRTYQFWKSFNQKIDFDIEKAGDTPRACGCFCSLHQLGKVCD